MLCVKYPTKIAIRNANVDRQENDVGSGNDKQEDREERMYLLSSYANSMIARCKKEGKDAKMKRASVIQAIGDGLSIADDDHGNAQTSSKDDTISHVVYDLCGYLLRTRKHLLKCPACLETLSAKDKDSLPKEHAPSTWTSIKSLGGLKFCSDEMFETFRAVEEVLRQHFSSNQVYMRDSFELVLSKLTSNKLKIPKICCDQHRDEIVPSLIYEYIMIRFHFQAKSARNDIKSKRKAHSLKKQSRVVRSATLNKSKK